MPGCCQLARWSPEVGGLEFQLSGCSPGPMWSRPASGRVLTPSEPAAWRPASSAAGATGRLAAGWSSRPCHTISPTRASSATTATVDQRMVRCRRRLASSRRAAAPFASLPLSDGRPLVAAPAPRPGWSLPVGRGFGLDLRVSAMWSPGAAGGWAYLESLRALGWVLLGRSGGEEAMRMGVLRTKSIERSIQDTEESEHRLRKDLTAWDLTVLGIGVIIGTGIFVLTGIAAATKAGPAVLLSFVLARGGCAPAAPCLAQVP